MRHLAPSAVIALVICGCALTNVVRGPDRYFTDNVPDGWIADFSYQEPLDRYIREHAIRAIALGRLPAIYFYSDMHSFCEFVRRRARSEYFQPVFKDTYIIMISYEYLQEALSMRDDLSAEDIAPATFVAISENGAALGPGSSIYSYDSTRYLQRRRLEYFFDRARKQLDEVER